MSDESSNPPPTFEHWIEHHFDHPVHENTWDIEFDPEFYDQYDMTPLLDVQYLSRLFESPAKYMETYSDGQLNQSLWRLISAVGTDLDQFFRKDIPLRLCIEGTLAMFNVFEQIFAPRCLSHVFGNDRIRLPGTKSTK